MEAKEFKFRIEVVVHFTAGELDHLLDLSRKHYDLRCRELSNDIEPHGKRGLLQMIKWSMELAGPDEDKTSIDWQLEWNDVDMLCKITESENLLWFEREEDRKFALHPQFANLIARMSSESRRVNKYPGEN